jgi:hypothetical protein
VVRGTSEEFDTRWGPGSLGYALAYQIGVKFPCGGVSFCEVSRQRPKRGILEVERVCRWLERYQLSGIARSSDHGCGRVCRACRFRGRQRPLRMVRYKHNLSGAAGLRLLPFRPQFTGKLPL